MAGNRAEIRAHIRSIAQTRKITDAMQLISGVMLNKEMANHHRVAAYAREVRLATKDALANCEDVEHPYLSVHKLQSVLVAGDHHALDALACGAKAQGAEDIVGDPSGCGAARAGNQSVPHDHV